MVSIHPFTKKTKNPEDKFSITIPEVATNNSFHLDSLALVL
jgi:hypothetical protein